MRKTLVASAVIVSALASTAYAASLQDKLGLGEIGATKSNWFLDVGVSFGADDQTFESNRGLSDLTAEGTMVYNVRGGKTNLVDQFGAYAEAAFSGSGDSWYTDYQLFGAGVTYNHDEKLMLSAGLGTWSAEARYDSSLYTYKRTDLDTKSGGYFALGASYLMGEYTATAQYNTVTGIGVGFGRVF